MDTDTNTKLGEAVPDLEQQPLPETKLDEEIPVLEQQPLQKTKLDEEALRHVKQHLPLPPSPPLPAAAGHKLAAGRSCDCELARGGASARASAAATRTMALVAATVGIAFAVHDRTPRPDALFAVFLAMFMIICISLSLFTWCLGMKDQKGGGAWPGTTAARVLLWSFAMALVLTMTNSVSMIAPPVAGSALFALGLVVSGLCFAESVPSVFRSRESPRAHDEPTPRIVG